MRVVSLLLCFLFTGTGIISGQNISASASSDARKVQTGDIFTVTYTLKNAEYSDFKKPSFENFNIVSGPSRSQMTRIINGNRMSETGLSYSLLATKAGNYTLEPGVFKTRAGNYKTNSIRIEVVGESQSLNSELDDIFLRTSLSADSASIGQQVLLTYTIYTNKGVQGMEVIEEDSYDEISKYNFRGFQRNPVTTVIDGKTYRTQAIRQVALFPQSLGTFVIDPMVLRANVVVEGKVRRGFFGDMNVTKPKIIRSRADTLHIVRNPKPDLLTGEFWIKTKCQQNLTDTDEGINLKLTMESTADPNLIFSPEITSNKEVNIFEPELIEENTRESDTEIRSRKVWEYLIIPQDTGDYYIQARYPYYDTTGTEQLAESITCFVDVRPGRYFGTDSLEIAQTSITDSNQSNFPYYWIIAAVLFLILLPAVYYFFIAGRSDSQENTHMVQNRGTHKIDFNNLKTELQSIRRVENPKERAKKSAAFLKKVGKLTGDLNVSQEYNIPEIRQAINNSLSVEIADRWHEHITKAENSIYGMAAESKMDEGYFDDVEELLEKIKKDLKN